MDKKELFFHRLTYSALIVLCLGTFTSVSFTALSHILLLFSGTYFLSQWLKKRDLPIKKSWWALGAVFISCILSVLANWGEIERPLRNILKAKYFLIALLSYFSFGYFKRDFLNHQRTGVLLKLFLLATSVATISGIIALYTGFNPLKMKAACHPDRACGLYGMYMTYGYGISLVMILLTGMLLNLKLFSKWVARHWIFAAFTINMVGLVLSYARGAWLGYLMAVPFFFFKDHKKKFVIACAAGCIFLGSSFLIPKVQDVFLKRYGSNDRRATLYKTALYALKEKPLFGHGYRNFEPKTKLLKQKYGLPYPDHTGHAHNNIFEHFASTGAVGGLALLVFFSLWLAESYYKAWLFSFVISFLVSGMVQYTFGDGENLFLILSIFSFF